MSQFNAVQLHKTVADPNAAYESMEGIWKRNRAVCSGERAVKDYDEYVDTLKYGNLLIPFSPTMNQWQYNFYKAEAELPGIVAQYSKTLIGALLRKEPQLSFSEELLATLGDTTGEVTNWLLHEIGEDDSSLSSFLDTALAEELPTGRCWIYIDYPVVPEEEMELMTQEDMLELKPYPVIWKADEVVNWTIEKNAKGMNQLTRIFYRRYEEDYTKNEFHPELLDTIYLHELDEEGNYIIRKFQERGATSNVPMTSGTILKEYTKKGTTFEEIGEVATILYQGEPLKFIPAWPLNGSLDITEPVLTNLVDKEISIYNKISRRNHLLYGASTYTPIITSDMSDEDFDKIVSSGLGTWIKLKPGDTASVLETPTAALADMEKAIAAAIEEMARLGVRMLSPEAAQSGVALQLRNATQAAQLGSLNMKISSQIREILAFMISWRYGVEAKAGDIEFSMSSDFTPTPQGEMWVRMVTEWYQAGLLPRSIWLLILQQNDILPSDYDDEEGKVQIEEDEMVMRPQDQARILQELDQEGQDDMGSENGEERRTDQESRNLAGDEG